MAQILSSERYNRQSLIENWSQEKLERARVVIIGSGAMANYAAISLASLGIGNIELYDNSKVEDTRERNAGEFLLFKSKKGQPKIQALEAILHEINPLTKIKGMPMCLENSPLIGIIGKPDLILDLTNSPESKTTALKYAQSKGIKVISASADESRAEMHLLAPGDNPNTQFAAYKTQNQGTIPSAIMGGMITEEVRKILMPLSAEEKPAQHMAYSLASDSRFSNEQGDLKQGDLKGKNVLVIGAGALGNFVALGLTLSGVGKLDILDYDEVDGTNLNRQILFYDSVGKKKSTALAEKLREISPSVKIRDLTGKLDENTTYFEENKPDLILDCVDSFAVRAFTNYFAVRYKIPVVSGGTNPKSGQVVVYQPGKTACLDCKLNVEEALGKALTSSSCRYAPDPSVIMTNQVVGNMMVGEAIKVLDNSYGTPVSRVLKYDSTAKSRGGLIGSIEPCECKKPEIKPWLEEVITKYGVKK